MKVLTGAALAALLATASTAGAYPHTKWAKWFAGQWSVSRTWCCSISDGHVLADGDWKMGKTHYWVRIDKVWYKVPRSALVDPKGGANPTGHPVVWYIYGNGVPTITCFCPGYLF